FDIESTTNHLETPVWRLLADRPAHLVPPWFSCWDDLLIAAVRESVDAPKQTDHLTVHTWGSENRLTMRHPLSASFRLLRCLLDAPPVGLKGDLHTPLAQTSHHGPVYRLVIAPGSEDRAVLQMCGGQAGNPLAPYYFSGHAEWLNGGITSL